MKGTEAIRALGLDLYARLRGLQGNALLSPYGVWMALALLHPGAHGKTLAQLSAVLGIDDVGAVAALARQVAHRAEPTGQWKDVIKKGAVGDVDPGRYGIHLEVANKLWVQSGCPIAPIYGNRLAEVFGADPSPVDFAGAPAAACDTINRWSGESTHGRIRQIVSPASLPRSLRALLANAIYFKAAWMDAFPARRTRRAAFHLLDGQSVAVPTMKRSGRYSTTADDQLTAVELPYIQFDVAMLVLVPHLGQFEAVDRALSIDRIDRIVAALRDEWVDLQMPRFRFETALALGPALSSIGLAEVLSPAADLSGVSGEPGFHVSEVLHKTFIAVDEVGTEAAAVTVGVLLSDPPKRKAALHIDRPFHLLIRDRPTGTPLFFGRVLDPR